MEDPKDTGREPSQMKREMDSIDDFEHLGHDSSPLKDMAAATSDLLGLHRDVEAPARDTIREINTAGKTVGSSVTGSHGHHVLDQPLIPQKMDSNLLQGGDHLPEHKESDTKIDKLLADMTTKAHQTADNKAKYDIQSFMDSERGFGQEKDKLQSNNDIMDRYSDSEPEEYHKASKHEDFPKKAELPESFGSIENIKHETFKDVDEFFHESPKKEPIVTKPALPEIIDPVVKKIEEKAPEPVRSAVETPKISEPIKPAEVKPQPAPVVKKPEPDLPKRVENIVERKPKIAPADAEAIFCKMGLDAWFNPEKLDPKVESLVYWREPKRSAPVFGGVLLVLLALTYLSLISVVAYLSLISLFGTIGFRIYKNIVQAIQKTGDGHPFKELLELDVSLPQEKVKEVTEVAVAHINAAVVELRRLFLVEDLVDSIKFGVLLWTLTYLGAWFNGMTLIIIAWVALFTLPKVYETNKTQIDANLDIVRTKLAEITSKIKAAIPMGKKPEEKKEQ
ncbi:unnamed protein product [Phaedon cochleariae]|uniref:Reticulon-like protein n=1 Tax=Phaedon cochleariae TaxID=80249 RepID=A0A9N9SH34_PHACE|nr:unnamed protein product [Phaedon cochleariae]